MPAPPPCSNCGAVAESDARFCGTCGERLGEPVPTPVAAEPAAAPERPAAAKPVVPALGDTMLAVPPARAAAPISPAPRPAAAPISPAPRPAAPAAPPSRPVAPIAPVQRPAAPAPRPAPGPPSRPAAPLPPLEIGDHDATREQPAAHSAYAAAGRGPAPATAVAPAIVERPSLDKLIGRTLNNRYLVGRKIGEGGFGAVFEGKQVATGREVALKVLHPHNVSDATVVARFRREAEACSKLRNAHTVTLYDFDETPDGILYLAMELVRGRSLQQIQKSEGPLAPLRVLNILHQIAEALGEAHEQGLVHRDMKPENVMLESRDGEDFVKVLDFGIAKIISGDAAKNTPALTAFGQTVGTLEFMSPEQLRGHTLDGRSDLYAIGMMSYEMLTGELPFADAKAPTDIIHFHLHKPAPAPSRLNPALKIPTAVDEVVLKMVAKPAEERHADAADLRRHIEESLAAIDTSAARREMFRMLAVVGGIVLLLAIIFLVASR
jgi:tRNA A-37 threonylcarbamoyl transferase component Bud32